MTNKNLIDEIIAQLDGSVEQGVGHMNIQVKEKSIMLEKIVQNEQNEIEKEVSYVGCVEGSNMACQCPTLMEGLDEKEN